MRFSPCERFSPFVNNHHVNLISAVFSLLDDLLVPSHLHAYSLSARKTITGSLLRAKSVNVGLHTNKIV